MGYNDVNRKREIIKIQKPIEVKVLDVFYSAKSSNKCEIEYNNIKYKTILSNKNIKKGSINNKNFYYDKQNEEVFSSNIGENAIKVGLVLFIISLLLWFIPSKKFTLW